MSWGRVFVLSPVINEPPPFNRDYNRDPNIQALKRRGFVHHGSTLSVCHMQPRILKILHDPKYLI